MATFLQLVNKVERESGTVGQSQRLGTVLNPSGRQEKIVAWTAQAWEMIQRERRDWTFRRKTFSANLTADVATYSPVELNIDDFGDWLPQEEASLAFTIYDSAIGRADETRLVLYPYEGWRDRYDVGVHTATRPNMLAVDWEDRLCFGPTPDKVYTVRGPYRRSIQTLAANTDTPFISSEFHDAIVWRALMLLAEHDEAAIQIGTASRNYAQIMGAMVKRYTEPVTL